MTFGYLRNIEGGIFIKAKYKTWIRKKKIFVFLSIFICLILVAIARFNPILSIIALCLSIPFIYIVFILTYTYYQFASFGGDYQAKIHNLIVANIITSGSGKLLDIGTGSASLIIKAAKAYPMLTLTGIDYWGEDWEYSKKRYWATLSSLKVLNSTSPNHINAMDINRQYGDDANPIILKSESVFSCANN
jgi:hypothetical protein